MKLKLILFILSGYILFLQPIFSASANPNSLLKTLLNTANPNGSNPVNVFADAMIAHEKATLTDYNHVGALFIGGQDEKIKLMLSNVPKTPFPMYSALTDQNLTQELTNHLNQVLPTGIEGLKKNSLPIISTPGNLESPAMELYVHISVADGNNTYLELTSLFYHQDTLLGLSDDRLGGALHRHIKAELHSSFKNARLIKPDETLSMTQQEIRPFNSTGFYSESNTILHFKTSSLNLSSLQNPDDNALKSALVQFFRTIALL